LVPIEQLVPDKKIFMGISHRVHVKQSLAVGAILVEGPNHQDGHHSAVALLLKAALIQVSDYRLLGASG
jgi:uncharacterized protein (UPF0303 family)